MSKEQESEIDLFHNYIRDDLPFPVDPPRPLSPSPSPLSFVNELYNNVDTLFSLPSLLPARVRMCCEGSEIRIIKGNWK
jgi:hypothetical protein